MSESRARRFGCMAGIIALLIGCVGIYAAGRFWPWDTTGEGPKQENYPSTDYPPWSRRNDSVGW